DVGDRELVELARERVAAARAAHAVDQRVPAQLAEQLLQVRERDALALADAGEGHRALPPVHGEVEHGGGGETSFGRESHMSLRSYVNTRQYPMNALKYRISDNSNQPLFTTRGSCRWGPSRSARRASISSRIKAIRLSMSTL